MRYYIAVGVGRLFFGGGEKSIQRLKNFLIFITAHALKLKSILHAEYSARRIVWRNLLKYSIKEIDDAL